MAEFTVYLFGGPSLAQDGQGVYLDTRKALALLAYLLISRRPHRRDTLAGLLWPEYSQTKARAALRRTLSTLNKALGGRFLHANRDEIGIQVDRSLWVDVLAFQAYLETPPGLDRIAALEKAAELYRADFLEGFSLRDSIEFDDWQYQSAERLRQEFSAALDELCQTFLLAGRYEDGIKWGQRRLALDNLQEDAHRQLMRLYALAGNRSAAVRQFRDCERILREELGVPPLEETVSLYQNILENRVLSVEMTPAQSRIPSSEQRAPSPHGILVGREMELEQLQAALSASAQRGYLVGLQGEAGIGKTTLIQAFLSALDEMGKRWVTVRCYHGEAQLAYNPLIDALRASLTLPGVSDCLKHQESHWLAETARLLPEITALTGAAAPQDRLDRPGAQNRFFEGLRQTFKSLLCGQESSVIFFDDLHWADHATLEWLSYLARRLQDFPVLVIAAWRREGKAGEILYRLASELSRHGDGKVISLQPFSRQETEELVRFEGLDPNAITTQFVERLYTESEGNPFFIVEFLRILKDADSALTGGAWYIPASVRDLLLSRLNELDEISLQVLGAAAVIGRSFDFDVLSLAAGRSEEETIAALEKLLHRGIIFQAENSGQGSTGEYDFHHEKMRALVYERLSPARRRLLHRRVAEALVSIPRFQRSRGQISNRIAYHFMQAGLEEAAADYYLQAGDYARNLFANREALEYFRTALRLGCPEEARIHESLGDLLTLSGEYPQAGKHYQKAASLVRGRDQARLFYKQGEVLERRGFLEQAESSFQDAVDCLQVPGLDSVLASRIYAAWSRVSHHRDEKEKAARLVDQALVLAGEDVKARLLALNTAGILARGRDDSSAALEHLGTSLVLARESGDLIAQAAVLNNIALALADQHKFDDALQHACAALEICRKLGDRHHEAALLNTVADIYHYNGQTEKAMEFLKQAVAIFAEIGQEDHEYQPEIWKLTEW